MNTDKQRISAFIRVYLCGFVVPFALGGCGYAHRVAVENDRLRARVSELETQIADLKHRTEGAEKGVEIEKQRASAGKPTLPEGVFAPQTSRIEITGPSRGVDTDSDGRDDAV